MANIDTTTVLHYLIAMGDPTFLQEVTARIQRDDSFATRTGAQPGAYIIKELLELKSLSQSWFKNWIKNWILHNYFKWYYDIMILWYWDKLEVNIIIGECRTISTCQASGASGTCLCSVGRGQRDPQAVSWRELNIVIGFKFWLRDQPIHRKLIHWGNSPVILVEIANKMCVACIFNFGNSLIWSYATLLLREYAPGAFVIEFAVAEEHPCLACHGWNWEELAPLAVLSMK